MDDGRHIGTSSTTRSPFEQQRVVEVAEYDRRGPYDDPGSPEGFVQREARYVPSPVRQPHDPNSYDNAGPSNYASHSPTPNYSSSGREHESWRSWEVNRTYRTEGSEFGRERLTPPPSAYSNHEEERRRNGRRNSAGYVANGWAEEGWSEGKNGYAESSERWSERSRVWSSRDDLDQDSSEGRQSAPPRYYDDQRRSPEGHFASPSKFRTSNGQTYDLPEEYPPIPAGMNGRHADPLFQDRRPPPRDAHSHSRSPPGEPFAGDDRALPRTPPRFKHRLKQDPRFSSDPRFGSSPRVDGYRAAHGRRDSNPSVSRAASVQGSSHGGSPSVNKPIKSQGSFKSPFPQQPLASPFVRVSNARSNGTYPPSASGQEDDLADSRRSSWTTGYGETPSPRSSPIRIGRVDDAATNRLSDMKLAEVSAPKGEVHEPLRSAGQRDPQDEIEEGETIGGPSRSPTPRADLGQGPSAACPVGQEIKFQETSIWREDPDVDMDRVVDASGVAEPTELPEDVPTDEAAHSQQNSSLLAEALIAEVQGDQELQDSLVKLRPAVTEVVGRKEQALHELVDALKERYLTLNDRWKSQCERLDRIIEARKQRLGAGKIVGTPATPGLSHLFGDEVHSITGRTSRRSSVFFGDAVRSEHEMESIIEKLQMEESQDPSFRARHTTAAIPDMDVVTPGHIKFHYDDTNGLVKDPMAYYEVRHNPDVWTIAEEQTFLESYGLFPKQFGRIAATLKNKSIPQCIRFYYLNKRRVDFRVLANKAGPGRRRGAARQGKGRSLLSDIQASAKHDLRASLQAQQSKMPTTPVAEDPGTAEEESSTEPESPDQLAVSLMDDDGADSPSGMDVDADEAAQTDDIDMYADARPSHATPTALQSPWKPGPSSHGDSLSQANAVSSLIDAGEDAKVTRRRRSIQEGTSVIPQRRRAATSSYWSVQEKMNAVMGREAHGTDWGAISAEVGSKTAVQVRNFFQKESAETLAGLSERAKGIRNLAASAPHDSMDVDQPGTSSMAANPNAVSFPSHPPPASPPGARSDVMPPRFSPQRASETAPEPAAPSTAPSPPVRSLPPFSTLDFPPRGVPHKVRLPISHLLNAEGDSGNDRLDWTGGSRAGDGREDVRVSHERYRPPSENSWYGQGRDRGSIPALSEAVRDPQGQFRPLYQPGDRGAFRSVPPQRSEYRTPTEESPYGFRPPSHLAPIRQLPEPQTDYRFPSHQPSRPYGHDERQYQTNPYQSERTASDGWRESSARPYEEYRRSPPIPSHYPSRHSPSPAPQPPYLQRRPSPPPSATYTFSHHPSTSYSFQESASRHIPPEFPTRSLPSPSPAGYRYAPPSPPPRFVADYGERRMSSAGPEYSSHRPQTPPSFPADNPSNHYYEPPPQSDYYARQPLPPPPPPPPWMEEQSQSRYHSDYAPEYLQDPRQYGR